MKMHLDESDLSGILTDDIDIDTWGSEYAPLEKKTRQDRVDVRSLTSGPPEVGSHDLTIANGASQASECGPLRRSEVFIEVKKY
jgi:hypothetical protein